MMEVGKIEQLSKNVEIGMSPRELQGEVKRQAKVIEALTERIKILESCLIADDQYLKDQEVKA